MSRSEGLVQRRIVSNSSANDKTNHCNNFSECVSNSDPKTSYNEFCDEDNDSKETRLTLMEEVLLLGLKDKEVLHLDL